MATNNEKEFKVGDTVWDCLNYGKGRVEFIEKGVRYPVHVLFNDDVTDNYMLDGLRTDSDLLPSLYHQPYTITLQEIPEELPEVGTPVYVWDNTDKACTIEFYSNKVGKKYITKTTTPPVGDAGSSWDNMSLTLPDKFK